MIAVRIGPDMRMAVVGAPSYFERRPPPRRPQDLTAHACINIRLPTYGGYYAWEFEKGGREIRVRVDGPLAFNTSRLALRAALAGSGLAYLLEDVVREDLSAGRLVRVLRSGARCSRAISCIILPGGSYRRRSLASSTNCAPAPRDRRR